MSSTDLSGALWRKSSYSNGQANCVEIAARGGRTLIAVRDSKAPEFPSLIFTAGAWRQFTESVKTTTTKLTCRGSTRELQTDPFRGRVRP